MNKPLFLNMLPISAHTLNMYVMTWEKTLEYTIPLYETPKGKPEIKIDKDNITLIFKVDGLKSNTIN